jgi:hypothetical protein
MKALRLSSFGQPLRMDDVPSPTSGPDDVVVEVRAAGICHSDAHYRGGRGTVPRLPVTPGARDRRTTAVFTRGRRGPKSGRNLDGLSLWISVLAGRAI